MKLSFTTMATPGIGAAAAVGLARKFGFGGIDLRVSDHLGEVTLESSKDEKKEVRDILASEGIILSGLLCYNKYGDSNENSWPDMKESLVRHLELAAVLGSEAIRIFAGNPLEYPDRDEFTYRTAEVVSHVLDSMGSDIPILLQNHVNGFTAHQAVRLAETIGKPGFGIVFSPDHCVLEKENPEPIYEVLKKHVKQLYIADLVIDDTGHKGVLPGQGEVPLMDTYQALGGKSFEGWVTFKWEKIWNSYLEGAETALPYFMRYIASLY